MADDTMLVELVSLGNGKTLNSENFARVADGIMLREKDSSNGFFKYLTTTKLRRIYGLIMNLYAQTNVPEDFAEHRGDLQYLKVKMAYEAGRERAVKDFLAATNLMAAIDSVSDYDKFMLYCRYAESLVAYFKFYGGKE